jgi:hypothetical protein
VAVNKSTNPEVDASFPELTSEYFRARNGAVITSVALFLWRVFGFDLRALIPWLQEKGVPEHAYLPHFIVAVTIYFLVRMRIEWAQSDQRRRSQAASKMDIGLTFLISALGVGVSYDSLVQNSICEQISIWIMAGVMALGVLFGYSMTFIIASVLTFRTKEERQESWLEARVPIPAKACITFTLPASGLILLFLYGLMLLAGDAKWPLFFIFVLTIPFVLIPFCLYDLKTEVATLKKASNAYEAYVFADRGFYRMRDILSLKGKITQKRVVRNLERMDARRVPTRHVLLQECVVAKIKGESGDFLTLVPKRHWSKYIKIRSTPKNKSDGSSHIIKMPIGMIKIDEHKLKNARSPEQVDKVIRSSLNCALEEFWAEHERRLSDSLSPTGKLMDAVYRDKLDQVQVLVNKGADVDCVGNGGWTPIIMASAQGYENIARLLLEKGASPNSANHLGRTGLHFSSRYGNQAMAKLLLNFGADVNLPDVHGNTPLIMAAQFGHNQLVTLLLDNNADGLTKNNKGRTAEEEARRSRFGTTARIIRTHINKTA